jgi:hypothetical protein
MLYLPSPCPRAHWRSAPLSSVPEGRRWPAHDDLSRTSRTLAFHNDGDPQALGPCPFGQGPDLGLAAEIAALALVGFEDEPVEVAEVVEHQAADLAGVVLPPFVVMMMLPVTVIMASRAGLVVTSVPKVPIWKACHFNTLCLERRECPENGGMTPLEVRSVGSIAGWGNTDAMGVAVDCDRR